MSGSGGPVKLNDAVVDEIISQLFNSSGPLVRRRVRAAEAAFKQTPAPTSVRYDIDLTYIADMGHPYWTMVNRFWAKQGAGGAECGGDFCDLNRRDGSLEAYLNGVRHM